MLQKRNSADWSQIPTVRKAPSELQGPPGTSGPSPLHLMTWDVSHPPGQSGGHPVQGMVFLGRTKSAYFSHHTDRSVQGQSAYGRPQHPNYLLPFSSPRRRQHKLLKPHFMCLDSHHLVMGCVTR